MIRTFDIENKAQAKEVIIKNPQKYKKWANVLANYIDKINFAGVPEYRNNAMINMLRSRCNIVPC